MILGTSPSVGAHDALLSGLSGPRGIPGAKSGLSPTPVAGGGMVGSHSHSASSPANYRGVLSSSPSENGNGNSMINSGAGPGAGAGGSSLSNSHSHSHGAGRRRSGDINHRAGGAIYVKPVTPAMMSPTVTGFNVPHEASRETFEESVAARVGGAGAGAGSAVGDAMMAGSCSTSVCGGSQGAAARMTHTFNRTPSPATQRSNIHQHDYAMAGVGAGVGVGAGAGVGSPAPVVGFNAAAGSNTATPVSGISSGFSGSGGSFSGGGLTKSLSAMQTELQSMYDGSVGIEATIAVPAVSNAAGAARPPSGRKSSTFGGLPRLSPGGFASSPAEKPPSGLLSGVPPLEALELEEEAMLFEAQERHEGAFSSPGVVSAFRVAAAAHRGQRRKSGEPVLRHCVETAVVLAELGMDYGVVAAGLLHDVLDDTPVTAAELRTVSGAAITGMVQGVSRLSHVSQISRDSGRELGGEERQRLRAMLIAMTDARVVIVKLADRLHNLNTLHHLGDDDKARRIAEETLAVYVPLASRLGIWTLKARLEDACFARLHPEEHARLSAELEEGEQRAAITDAVGRIASCLDDAGVTGYGDICGRPKSLFSVYRKMCKKGVALEDIHDVRALRVIVAAEEDCYAALEAVHARPGWTAVEGKTKDYVRHAKRNGYQSLHTVVREDATGAVFEVQIRTATMHHAAEYGLAAHWRYKETSTSTGAGGAGTSGGDATHRAVDEQVAWARFMLSWQSQLADNKCRAADSGGGGGVGGGGAGAGSAREFCQPCPCPFPTHHPECHNHEDNLSFGCCKDDAAATTTAAAASAAAAGMWDSLESPLVSADSASAGGVFFSPSSPLVGFPGGGVGAMHADAAASSATAAAPIFVIAVVDGEMRVVETARGTRLSDVDVVGGAGAGAGAAATARVVVNRETVPPGAEVAVQLRMGDLIEVTTTTNTSTSSTKGCAALGSEAAAAVEKQRRSESMMSMMMSHRTDANANDDVSSLGLDVSTLNINHMSNNVVKRGSAPKGFHP